MVHVAISQQASFAEENIISNFYSYHDNYYCAHFDVVATH